MTTATDSYVEEIAAWRAEAEAALRADEGWLSLVGLYWLQEGPNTLGSHPASAVLLPPQAPALVGRIELRDGAATLHAYAAAGVTLGGQPAGVRALRSDADGPPDRVQIGDLTLWLIQRGARLGVRISDRRSPLRREFQGRFWFPVDERLRLSARFEPYDPPRPLAITNIIGDTSSVPSPGAAVFSLDGREYRLDASAQSERGLQFVFRDQTSGRETYAAARFLSAAPPQDGLVTLDFNRAVHPPCAFTDYATCPLPPAQNHLPVRIAAGERLPD